MTQRVIRVMAFAAAFGGWGAPAFAAGDSDEALAVEARDTFEEPFRRMITVAPIPAVASAGSEAVVATEWERFFSAFKEGKTSGEERRAWEEPLPWAPFYPVDKTGEKTHMINPLARYAAWTIEPGNDSRYSSTVEAYYFREPFRFYCIYKENGGKTQYLPRWEEGARWRFIGDPRRDGARFEDVIVLFNSSDDLGSGGEKKIREGFVVDSKGEVLAAFTADYGIGYTQGGRHSGALTSKLLGYRLLDPADAKKRWTSLLALFLEIAP